MAVLMGLLLLPRSSPAQSVQQGWALINEAGALEDRAKSRDDLERAQAKYQQALRICGRAKSDKCIGHASVQIGHIYERLGQYPKALECFEKSLAIARGIGDTELEEVALNNIGRVYQYYGQYSKALEYYEKSLAMNQKLGDVRGKDVTLNNIGRVYFFWGQYPKALEYYEKSLAIAQKLGDVKSESVILHCIGHVYDSWGQYPKALEYYEKSLAIAQKLGDVKVEGVTLSNIGAAYQSSGQYPKALEYYQKALAIAKQIGVPHSDEEKYIAAAHLEMGDLSKAEQILARAGGSSPLGMLALIKSNFSEAKRQYEYLLRDGEKSGDFAWLFVAYTGLGRAHEGLEDYRKAEEYYEKGMNLVEELRAGLLPTERKNFFDVKVSGFLRSEPSKGLTRVRMKLNQSSESIDSSEVTRARSFSDKIAQTGEGGVSGVPKAILEKEDQIVSRVAALKKELAKTDKEKQGGRCENLSKEVQEADKDLKALVEMLWDKYKAYAAVKYPRPVTLKESSLRPDECVIMFDVSNEGVGVKLVKGKKILQTFYSDWPASELERDVKKFREPFETREIKAFDPKLGEALYKKLLTRVLMDVPIGTPITIIPDGVLAILPFEALVVSEKSNTNDKITYVSDLYPISYYQSITALTLARTMRDKKKTGNRVLVIADPVFHLKDERAQAIKQTGLASKDKEYIGNIMNAVEEGSFKLRRLPETAVLAANLKSLYGSKAETCTDFKANKADFLKNIAPKLDQYSSVVFATHGVFSTKVPGLMEPFLALTMVPHGTDGFLKMSDVMGLKMNADIVALTACQTGLGKELSGEGVMSMGRAFQYAGARTVLMSLWSVAEKSSVQLVESFFRNLKQGKSKLESLRLAREEIRKAGYDHPFFWAPFILVGETD